jgi:bis(5'-nucleosyl)-tetraphosphatase (symmetrical)
MATYAIGDLQGCFLPLARLLNHIQFDAKKDIVWFTGDLVNRGPQSLETLRFVKNLGGAQQTVLGNHDLHLLALAHSDKRSQKESSLDSILSAPDRDELIHWLRQQPILHHDSPLGWTLVHAGFPPSWDLATAKRLANEVETVLRGDQRFEYFDHMYGNEPNLWSEKLTGWDRLRCITNCFTRIRFCNADGSLDLIAKGENQPDLIPWFCFPDRLSQDLPIVFGHWAAINGVTGTPNAQAADTGCVWGNRLTAIRLEDSVRFSVSCEGSV